MKTIQLEELRELQMGILDYVDAFCRKNHIRYTISGGTLLGAVRHGGYIPWDDDIDIQMLRDEYDHFSKIWNEKKNEHPFEFISIESGNDLGYAFGKIHDPRTVTYVRGLERTGVFIDVFPIDKVVDDKDFAFRRKRIKRLKRQERAAFLLSTKSTNHIRLCQAVKCFFLTLGRSRSFFAKKINDIAKSKNCYDAPLVFEMVAGVKCKQPMPKHIFDEFVDIAFEDRSYMAVKNYDAYLTSTFGDYMTLPPVDKRKREHDFVPYWK